MFQETQINEMIDIKLLLNYNVHEGVNKMNNQNEKLKLIEEYGLFLEKSGYIPSAARVYALLLIWEPEELHFEEVREILNLSKGATSKALNQLIHISRVKTITKPGIRKKFYKANMIPGKESVETFVSYITSLRGFMRKIIEVKEDNSEIRERLEDSERFFSFLKEQLEDSVKLWKEK